MKSIYLLILSYTLILAPSKILAQEVWISKTQFLNGTTPTVWRDDGKTYMGMNLSTYTRIVDKGQYVFIPVTAFAFGQEVAMSIYENGNYITTCYGVERILSPKNNDNIQTKQCQFYFSKPAGTYKYKIHFHHAKNGAWYPWIYCNNYNYRDKNEWCRNQIFTSEHTISVIENQLPSLHFNRHDISYDPNANAVNMHLRAYSDDFTTHQPNNNPHSVSFFMQYGNDAPFEVRRVYNKTNGAYELVIPNVQTGRSITLFARVYDGFNPSIYIDSPRHTFTDINRLPSATIETSKREYKPTESIDFTAIISDDIPINSDYQAHICYQKENEAESCICFADETDGQCNMGFLGSPDSVDGNGSLYRTTKLGSLIGLGNNVNIWTRVIDPLGKVNDLSGVTKKSIDIVDNYSPKVAIVQPYPNNEYREGDLVEVVINASDEDGTIEKINLAYSSEDNIIGCYSATDESCTILKQADGTYLFEWASNQTTDIVDGYLYVTTIDDKDASKTPVAIVKTTIKSLKAPPAPNIVIDSESPDGDGRFYVNWESTNAERYMVYRCDAAKSDCTDTTENSWQQVRQLDNFQTGILEAGLPNGDYQYKVTACAVNYEAHLGEDPLCENTSAIQSITVTHAAPSFLNLDEYLFEATQQTNAGDYSVTWQVLDEASAGAVVDFYQLHEKQGNLQCENPDNDGYCEDEWLPVDTNVAVVDEVNNTMTVTFNDKPLGKGLYSYRLQACNHQSGCTTGPIIEVAIMPPLIQNLAVACHGTCLQLSGQHFDNGATVDLSAYGDQIKATLPSSDVSWQHQGFMEVNLGENTSFTRAIGDSGLTLTLTNPNGTTFTSILKPNQQSSSIDLTDADPVISKDLDQLYVTVGNKVHAVDLATGELIENTTVGWPFTVPESTLTTPVVNLIDGNFYVGSTDSHLYAVDDTGFLYWKTETGGAIVAEPALGETSIVYTGSMDGKLYALHPENGNIAWLRHTDESGISQKPRLQGDDLIYVTTAQGQVHLINRGELDQNTLVWESKDDSLMAYELKVGNWQPNRLYNHKDYIAVAKLYRLILQPELSPDREVLTFWTFARDQRVPLKTVANAFLESNQGQVNYPAGPVFSDADFIKKLYKQAFGETGKNTDGNEDLTLYRSLTISESEIYDYHQLLTLLQNEGDRAAIVLLFTASVEYNQAVINLLNAQYDYFYEEDFSWTISNCETATCDSDNDGLYDWWEELYFGNITEVDSNTEINGTPVSESFIYDENPCQAEGCFDKETPPEIAHPSIPSPDASDIEASDQIGTVAGNFAVTEAGAATYSVPIIVAPGVAGVTPEVSLAYTSQGNNGFVGYGFGINGLSAITRCRSTKAINKVAKPINFDNNDRFCMDGQQLINLSGGYHANGSTYQTEINNEAKVVYYHDGNGGYFEVKRKDGSTSYFGKTADSKQQASNGAAFVWGISSFKDSVGDAADITYHYLPQSKGNTSNYLGYNNILAISDIRYAYGTASDAGASIAFEYSSNRADPLGGFTSGEYFGSSKRLERVVSYSNGEEIRRFNLKYKPITQANAVSKLQTIEECVGEYYCKIGMLTFGWTEPRMQFDAPIINHTDTDDVGIYSYRNADINGDGAMDIIWLQWRYKPQADDTDHRFQFLISKDGRLEKTNFYNPDNPNNGHRYLRFSEDVGDEDVFLEVIDYNVDGRHDALVYRDVGANWLIYLSTPMPDGSWRLNQHPIVIPEDSNGNKLPQTAQFLDVNSDGLPDAVYTVDKKVFVRELTLDLSQPATSNTRYHFTPFARELILTEHLPPVMYGDIELRSYYLVVPGGTADFNGDGIVDITLKHSNNIGIYNQTYERMNGRHYLVNASGQLTPYGEPLGVNNSGGEDLYRTSFTDINGDGLTDVFFNLRTNNNEMWQFKLSTGRGFTRPVDAVSLPRKIVPRLVDYNQDGYPDLMWVDGQAHVRLWNPAINNFNAETITFGQYGSNKNVIYADVNGDAVGDMIEVNNNSQTFNVYKASKVVGDVWENGQLYFKGDVQTGKAHMITSIDNGFGSRTDITYDSLSTSDHYTNLHIEQNHANDLLTNSTNHRIPYSSYLAPEYYARVNGNLGTPAGHQTLGRENQEPILDLRAPVYVVTDVSSTMPTAGSEPGSINHNDRGTVSYYYSDAKLQASGRGLLGFAEVKTLDSYSQIVTTTHYRQDFPFMGLAWKTEKQILGGNLLSSAINQWEIQGWNGNQGELPQPPYRLMLKTSTETGFDLETGTPLKRVTSHTESLDSDGNVLDMRVATEDLTRGEVFTTITSNTYHSDTEGQWLGRLTGSTVTHQRPNTPDVIRTSAFTYYENTHWMIESETVEPGSTHVLTTRYTYDAVGNKLSVTSEGMADLEGSKQTRGKTYVYDSDRARYLTETYNSKGQLLQRINPEDRTAAGEIKKVTDANGVFTQAVFGKFGSKVFEWNSVGSSSNTRVYKGTGSYCDYPTQYHLVTEASDGSRSFICYDPLGREIKKGKLGFHGYEWYVTKTAYDHLGKVRYQTLPYTEDQETPQWITYSYDRLGRKTATYFPDGTSEQIDYQGYNSVFTNRLGDSRTDEKNGLGELIKTTDALSGTITYTYDAVGNTLSTTTDGPTKAAGVSGAITVSMTYGPDNHARWKTSMNDPDKGHWQYRYNAFGEVMEQIDARGRSTVTHRDILGREVCRVDYLDASHTTVESSSQWFYDTAPKPDNGNGQTTAIGQLHRVVKSDTACNSTQSYDANTQYAYEQVYHYDAFGRNHMTDTLIDGETFTTRVTYDEFGRTFQSFDAAGNDRGTRNIYNDQGYLSEIRDAQVYNNAQAVYRKILEMDARGNVTQEFSHNGMTTTRAYDPIHGMITEIYTALEGVLIAQDLIMHYDALGNLLRREDNERGHYESFCYDALNRMTGSALNAQCTEGDIQYDSFGNFINKPNVGDYTYGEQAGPHAVTSTEKDDVITTYQYDANGNMVSDSTGRQLVYSQFDKPTQITKGQSKIEFDYGPGRSRYKRTDTDGENTTTTLYLGNVEIITRNGVREAKRYIAGNTISTDTALDEAKAPQTASFQFMFKDHLGSVDIILTETPHEADGQILMSFDAWGLRRNAATLEDGFNLAEIINQSISATTRGFTGHEMLDLVGLIHMNGRVYDPLLGRFLSADPFIQSPTETQSYNRYAYLWNNPLSSTDPTGYWDNRKMQGIFGSVLQTIGSVMIATGVGAPFGAALIVAGGVLTGKAMGNVAQGVAIAVFSAAAFYGIGQYFQGAHAANAKAGVTGTYTFGGLELTAGQIGAQVASHAVVGGVIAEVQGGNFGHGFFSAGITKALGGAFMTADNHALNTFSSAMIGGTASELTGGKFANGAAMGAFQYAFNQAGSQIARSIKNRITISHEVDGDYHKYKVRGLICSTSTKGCNAEYADQVFAYVNENDVPFSNDDSGSGYKNLLNGIPRPLGNQPIYHSENIEGRISVNITLKGHNFHPGDVTHRVHFENGNLYYDMTGTGTGSFPKINNFMGIQLFKPGVQNAVNKFGL